MESFYFLFFEFGTLLVFLAILARERINREMREVLILALAYGLILEILNVNFSGSYRYSGEFALRIFGVPIAIGIGWAIIYYLAFKTAGIYRLKWWHSPFLMALIAVSVDLIFDIIAVRLGFWQWSIPLNQEWFGVPYDNLFGWMAVVWTFAFLINLSRENLFAAKFSRLVKYLTVIVSPFLLGFQITAYASLSAGLSGKFSFGEISEFYRRNDFSYAYYPEVQTAKAYVFWAIAAILAAYLARTIYQNRKNISAKPDKFSFLVLLGMHTLFIAAIFTAGLQNETPVFIVIAVATLVFQFIINLCPKFGKN